MTDASPAEHDSLLGTRIDGRYSVIRELGRGGMGVVYEGVHDDLGRPVAIKVLNLAWASDPTAVARFLREARTASSFSHGNIVDVTDLGRLPDGRPYLIMPKVTGTDLAAMLTENGAQPAKRVAQLLLGVAAALDLIHAKGFVHRDIKPENLMYVVREDGSETVMLLDFGIAAAVMSNEPRLTGQGAIFGTPQFMPPEVCNGGMPDARGDVYALATVAFELITGVLPFGDDNMMRVLTAKLTSDPPTLSEASGVPFPPELEEVIARGLARNPADRYATASEFVGSLRAATDHAPVSWRSGVLRPSFRSAAHPVGSHQGAFSSHPPAGLPHAATQRTPGKPIERPRGTPQQAGEHWSNRAIGPVSQGQEDWQARPSTRDEHARDDYRSPSARASDRDQYRSPSARASDRDQYRSPSARASDRDQYRSPSSHDGYARGSAREYPRESERDEYQRDTDVDGHWASRAAEQDPWGRSASALGAGLRSSERHRPVSERPSGGKRVAVLLGVAALLLGVLWYRNNRGSEARPSVLPPPAAQQAPAGANTAAAAEAPTAPANPLKPDTLRAEGAANAAVPAGEDPAVQPTQPPSAAAANADPSSPSVAAPQAPTPAPSGANEPSGQAAVAVPVPTGKFTHPGARPPVAAAKPSGLAVEPPAPRADAPQPELPSAEPPAAPSSSPVLVVEEQTPPPAEEELPDLPVRSAESQAAQLAKDASTALLSGEVGHAIELLREATRLDPDQSLAWRTMGLAFERSGDTQAALAAYRQYIRLAPHGPQADLVRERMRTLENQ